MCMCLCGALKVPGVISLGHLKAEKGKLERRLRGFEQGQEYDRTCCCDYLCWCVQRNKWVMTDSLKVVCGVSSWK